MAHATARGACGALADRLNRMPQGRVLFSHRAMAAIPGVILRLPPTRQVLANRQVKSRYLASLLERISV